MFRAEANILVEISLVLVLSARGRGYRMADAYEGHEELKPAYFLSDKLYAA